MNEKTLTIYCEDCYGEATVTYDDAIFIEPDKCPFCGKPAQATEERYLLFPDKE